MELSLKPLLAGALLAGAIVQAQVPPKVAADLVDIGRGVCFPQTAALYQPLQPKPPYTDVEISRDVSFGPNKLDVIDLVTPKAGSGNLPVLVYIPGGAGNKQADGEDGAPFYSNVAVWAARNGMVGVVMQRHPGAAWDDPAKDIGMLVQRLHDNIGEHKGNPNRIFLWAQSAGNIPTATYIGHPELYGPDGVGIKGVVFMSAPGFNILPVTPPAVAGGIASCGEPGAPATATAAKGKGKGGKGKGGKGKGRGDQPDQATMLAQSNLPGLTASNVPMFISAAELDPESLIAFAETLRDQLVNAGKKPQFRIIPKHSHISQVMSANTADTSVTGPILQWMQIIK